MFNDFTLSDGDLFYAITEQLLMTDLIFFQQQWQRVFFSASARIKTTNLHTR